MTIIGVLDSGVGGLSVLRKIHRLLPEHPTLYFADQGHLPYGPRDPEEVRGFVTTISDFLISRGAHMIVMACNTASAFSLLPLRERYGSIPIVGMEPAVKPAAEHTKTGVIAVLTTQATANGPLYKRVIERYAQNVKVITVVSPRLVALVESNRQTTPEGLQIVAEHIEPAIAQGADQIVLACTHFPFLNQQIEQVAAGRAEIVDPSEAIARQVRRVMPEAHGHEPMRNQYFTSGNRTEFIALARHLYGEPLPEADFYGVIHRDGQIHVLRD